VVGGVAHPASINKATNGKRSFFNMFRLSVDLKLR